MADEEAKKKGSAKGRSQAPGEIRKALKPITVNTGEVIAYTQDLKSIAGDVSDARARVDQWPYFSAYAVPDAFLITQAKQQLDTAHTALTAEIGKVVVLMKQYVAMEASYPGTGLPAWMLDAIFSQSKFNQARLVKLGRPVLAASSLKAPPDADPTEALSEHEKLIRDLGLLDNALGTGRTFRATLALIEMRQRIAVMAINNAMGSKVKMTDQVRALRKLFPGEHGVGNLSRAQLKAIVKAYHEGGKVGFTTIDEIFAAAGKEEKVSSELYRTITAAADARAAQLTSMDVARLYHEINSGDLRALAKLSQLTGKIPGRQLLNTPGGIKATRFVGGLLRPLFGAVDVYYLARPGSDRYERISAGLGLTAMGVEIFAGGAAVAGTAGVATATAGAAAVGGATVATAEAGAAVVLAEGAAASGATVVGAPVAIALAVAAIAVAGYGMWHAHEQAQYEAAYEKARVKAFNEAVKTQYDTVESEVLLEQARKAAAEAHPTPVKPVVSPFGRSFFNTTTTATKPATTTKGL
jgi:hypothetical protein